MAKVWIITLGLTLVYTVNSTPYCFCQGLSEELNRSCRFGKKIQDQVANSNVCYEHCDYSFIRPMQVAACFKGCLSEACTPATLKGWTDSIKNFFKTQNTMTPYRSMSESVIVLNTDQKHVVYALYVNGQPVFSKRYVSGKNSHIISYTYTSWWAFEQRTDMLMTFLAALCFFLGLVLLISPCFDEEDEEGSDGPKKTKSGENFKKNIEKQEFTLDVDDDLRKALLDH